MHAIMSEVVNKEGRPSSEGCQLMRDEIPRREQTETQVDSSPSCSHLYHTGPAGGRLYRATLLQENGAHSIQSTQSPHHIAVLFIGIAVVVSTTCW